MAMQNSQIEMQTFASMFLFFHGAGWMLCKGYISKIAMALTIFHAIAIMCCCASVAVMGLLKNQLLNRGRCFPTRA